MKRLKRKVLETYISAYGFVEGGVDKAIEKTLNEFLKENEIAVENIIQIKEKLKDESYYRAVVFYSEESD